ncbi:aliphatic sulfonates family ABC transporter periplasmic ligand-binding protein [Companilactobacillus kimchiensis]|uniref:Aliphatic sulfonates family ABC transporter periplasmic ligand-binding protein n=1 Tax=Companilactobacillus kimchiensis TaxID=993692 RepID=A0A0R2LDR8_9LACO|nr:aliphatic sulfonates family ABC transporter periplasmic ligand-binding protein [Companilactobacillus kimchiensis]
MDLLMILTFSLVSCSSNDNLQTNEIRIGILNTPNDVAVARNKNYFQKAFPNKKITFITFDSGVDANKALMSGGVDFATMGDTNGIVALTAGIPVKLLWINEICGSNECLIVRKNSGIKSIADLKGKKIATPFASTSHYSLMITLRNAGLENKVKLLDMDTQNIVAAWKRGNIDAAYTWQPTLSQLQNNGQVLTDSSDLFKKGYSTANITLVSKVFLKAHPNEVRKVVQVLAKTHRLRKDNYQMTVESAAKQTGISQSDAAKQIKGTKWISLNEEYSKDYLGNEQEPGQFILAMQRAGKFMYGQQTISYAPSLKQFQEFVYAGGN